MNKFLKYFLILLLVIVVLVLGFAAFVQWRPMPTYESKELPVKFKNTPEELERGKQIATLLCQQCHLDPKTGKLTGNLMADIPPSLGKAYSRNITHDKEFGIGTYTDGQLAYLLRTGIARDGRYTPPWMVKLPRASNEDIAAVIRWLRSDDPILEADKAPNRESEPAWFGRFLMLVAFKPLPEPTKEIPLPTKAVSVEWGQYMADNLIGCFGCHSADFSTMNELDPPKSAGYYGGGNKLKNMELKNICSANISPDKETGIGNWTEDQFISALKYGSKPDGSQLRYPMVPHAVLDSVDCKAIFAFLKTVPAVKNKVDREITD